MLDEDKTYENEVVPISDDRGSLDLTRQIDELNKKVKNLDGLEKIHRQTNGDLRIHILKLDKKIYELKKIWLLKKKIIKLKLWKKIMKLAD